MAQITVYLGPGTGNWTVPADCILLDSVDCIGSAGSGAAMTYNATNAGPTGGGGGAFSRKNNIPVLPGQVIPYRAGMGGAGVSASTPGSGAWGNAGQDTYFGSYYCYAQAGQGGRLDGAGGAGGAASAGIGDVRYSGGRGGNAGAPQTPTGGGGCAGPNGNGVNGQDPAAAAVSLGGAGDAYAGGAGSSGHKPGFNTPANSAPGGTGTELGSGYGCGGGSGSAYAAGAGYVGTSGTGGQFGGASGGGYEQVSGGTGVSGQAHHGFIVIRYTPVKKVPPFNMPMMGL